MDSTGYKKSINDRLSTSSNRAFPSLNKISKCRKRVLGIAVDESSSSSEDTELVPKRRKRTLRALSDYESDDNDVGKAGSSSASSFRDHAAEGVTKKTTTGNVCCSTSFKYKDSSGSDSDELFLGLTSRQGSVRSLSDYDSGDSVYQAGKALLYLSRGNRNVNNSPNSSQNNDVLDLSCKNSTVYNKFKRPCITCRTSDSSDSESSIMRRCFTKRMRINISRGRRNDINTKVARSHRSCRPNQNDLTRTNGGIDYLDTRPQMTRNLRQKMNNQLKCRSSGSDSSSVELVRRVMRDGIEYVSATVNIIYNNSQQNLMEGSSIDGQLKRNVYSARNERITQSTLHNSRPPATVQQTIRRTRQLINRNRHLIRRTRTLNSRNNQLEEQTVSSQDTESELSSDNVSAINSVIRLNTERHVDSSDSDSDIQFEPRRLRCGTVQLNSSDSDSNFEQTPSDTVINSDTANSDVSPNSLIQSIMQDVNSSDSDANSEKCPICFCCFGKKEVASPVSCDHSFCTQCIEEWAKNKNTCPIDRKHFDKLLIRPNFFHEKCIRVISIETPVKTRFWEVESDLIDGGLIEFGLNGNIISSSSEEEEICSVCHSSNYPLDFIMCEMCDNAYHLGCLTPPLRSRPASNWFCAQCENVMD